MLKKINLAVVFYGDRSLSLVRRRQFKDLSKLLTSFYVKKYYFNASGRRRLLKDFQAGNLDIVLKNSHGRGHENDVELFLEKNNIPFLGSGSRATLIGTSKYLSKQRFKAHRLPVAEDLHVSQKIWRRTRARVINFVEDKLNYPCIVKDVGGSDSRGLYFIRHEEKLKEVMNRLMRRNVEVIIEKFISRTQEATCLVVGNRRAVAYEPVEIVKDNDFFSSADKDHGACLFRLPARLSPPLIKAVKQLSASAHRSLGCRTFSRADILIKGKKLYLLEVDIHPGFQSISPTFKSARFIGESPDELFLKFYKSTL